MRRSSITVSPRAILRRLHGEKLLQNSSDRSSPSAPASMRMIPTVLMLNPEALTSTAKVRIAPTTRRKMLTPILIALASSTTSRPPSCRQPCWWAAPVDRVRRMKVTPFDLCVLLIGADRSTGGALRAWEPLSRCPASQLSGSRNRLLLTAGDRCLGHVGHGRQGRTPPGGGGNGHQFA